MSQPAYEPQEQYPQGTRPARRPVAAAPVAAQPVARRRSSNVGGLMARIVLTCLGAAGLIVGAFLNWIQNIDGVRLDDKAFYQQTFLSTGTFVRTVGFVMIVLGLLALLGLSPRSGWLTRFAGALGVIGFVLVVIEMFRVAGDQTLQSGAWLCLAGGIVALIGGFFGTRRVVATAPATTAGTTVVE
jgi:hypothetical protein